MKPHPTPNCTISDPNKKIQWFSLSKSTSILIDKSDKFSNFFASLPFRKESPARSLPPNLTVDNVDSLLSTKFHAQWNCCDTTRRRREACKGQGKIQWKNLNSLNLFEQPTTRAYVKCKSIMEFKKFIIDVRREIACLPSGKLQWFNDSETCYFRFKILCHSEKLSHACFPQLCT